MGRENGLFSGLWLLEAAKNTGLETHTWLTNMLKRLPLWPEERQDESQPCRSYHFIPSNGAACGEP